MRSLKNSNSNVEIAAICCAGLAMTQKHSSCHCDYSSTWDESRFGDDEAISVFQKFQMRKGFVLVAVMLILFLMGTEFLILNSTSNHIAIETNNILLQADKQNLISSGLALVKSGSFNKGDVIIPDTSALAWKDSKMSIKIGDAGLAELNIFCKRGTRELISVKKYYIAQ